MCSLLCVVVVGGCFAMQGQTQKAWSTVWPFHSPKAKISVPIKVPFPARLLGGGVEGAVRLVGGWGGVRTQKALSLPICLSVGCA